MSKTKNPLVLSTDSSCVYKHFPQCLLSLSCSSIMASAAPQKRMVSSVFITLASPSRATVTPTAHGQHSPARAQNTAPTGPCRTHVVSGVPPAPRDLCDPKRDLSGGPAEDGAVLRSAPSAGGQEKQQSDTHTHCSDVCGFCRKQVSPCESAIVALNRCYHSGCFQCRQCCAPLAGRQYYSRSGLPLCEACHQASLEPCWACGDVIKDHVIRALERAYHPPCFVCTTCRQPIGEQRFAQGEVGEVYCLQDYYRKYAPQCGVCGLMIIPRDDGTDSFTVECLGRSYHEDCYRCQVCAVLLSPEPDERGCHPLDGQMLCRTCHSALIH